MSHGRKRVFERGTGWLITAVMVLALCLGGCSKETEPEELSAMDRLLMGVTADETDRDAQADASGKTGEDESPDSEDGDGVRSARAERGRSIVVSLPESADPWHVGVWECALAELENLGDETGYILFTASTADEQAQQLSELERENTLAVVIEPVASSGLGEAVSRLLMMGIPVIAFDGDITGAQVNARVILDQQVPGQKCGGLVNNLSGSDKSVVVFSNETSNRAMLSFSMFEAELSDDWSVLYAGNAQGDTELARSMTRSWLEGRTTGDLEKVYAIFAPDADTMTGVIQGLTDFEESPKDVLKNLRLICTSGYNDDLRSVMNEQSGYRVIAVDYPAEAIATAIGLAEDAAEYKTVEATLDISPTQYTNSQSD